MLLLLLLSTEEVGFHDAKGRGAGEEEGMEEGVGEEEEEEGHERMEEEGEAASTTKQGMCLITTDLPPSLPPPFLT